MVNVSYVKEEQYQADDKGIRLIWNCLKAL